jgi:hypothetical protein
VLFWELVTTLTLLLKTQMWNISSHNLFNYWSMRLICQLI